MTEINEVSKISEIYEMAKTYEISAISTVSKNQSTVDPANLNIPVLAYSQDSLRTHHFFHLFYGPAVDGAELKTQLLLIISLI